MTTKLATFACGSINAEKVALVLPGFLDTKDYPHMQRHVEFLAEQGYYALSFDPPGTWESGDNVSQYTITNYLKAIDELITECGSKPTLLVGHSMGGMVAMLAAARNSRVSAFVAIMSSYAYVRDDNHRQRLVAWQTAGTKVSTRDLPHAPSSSREFVLPYTFVKDAEQYNALDILKTLTKPKLFISGVQDELIPTAVVQKSFESAAEPKEFVTVDSNHDYRKNPATIEKINALLGGFIRTLNA